MSLRTKISTDRSVEIPRTRVRASESYVIPRILRHHSYKPALACPARRLDEPYALLLFHPSLQHCLYMQKSSLKSIMSAKPQSILALFALIVGCTAHGGHGHDSDGGGGE